MATPWYNLTEEERIKEIYSKYTIKDFFIWWAGEEQRVMEVRIKDFPLLQQIAISLNLPYSASGIYVWNDIQLKQVIGKVRNIATIWFGVNPRKKNWNKRGWKVYEGKDTNVQEVTYLMIDIDRIEKKGPANNKELENCDKLADIILTKLEEGGWNKNYCKICSGNGVQLIVKLDFPMRLPDVVFDNQTKAFNFNSEFEKTKHLIPHGIGQDILKFTHKYKEDLGVEVDKACFNISRVASLPFTKNYKYDGFTWRGIVELHNGINVGFSDYILSREDEVKKFNPIKIFTTKSLTKDNRLKEGKLRDHKLIKFMLDNELPYGMINNYIWFQIKCLIRDSGIDINGQEFRTLHKELEKKFKGNLTLNIPDKKYPFDENTVNKFCIENMFIPIYPLWPARTKKLQMLIDDVKWEEVDLVDDIYELPSDTNIFDDLNFIKDKLVETSLVNITKFKMFVKGCKKKYGIEKTKYLFDNIMKHYLSFQ